MKCFLPAIDSYVRKNDNDGIMFVQTVHTMHKTITLSTSLINRFGNNTRRYDLNTFVTMISLLLPSFSSRLQLLLLPLPPF